MQAKAEIAGEKLAALHTIHAKLQEAVAIIRATQQEAAEANSFTEPRRLGGPQPLR